MKNEKGITLAILAITIIVMVILAGAVMTYGTNSLNTAKLKNFNYEMQQIQGKVDPLYEKIKMGDDEYIILGRDITQSGRAMDTLKKVKEIDYPSITDFKDSEYYTEDGRTTYRYFTEEDLKEELDITSNPGDVIINFLTKEVISVNGIKYEGHKYYKANGVAFSN